jgi:hypothetical protein
MAVEGMKWKERLDEKFAVLAFDGFAYNKMQITTILAICEKQIHYVKTVHKFDPTEHFNSFDLAR